MMVDVSYKVDQAIQETRRVSRVITREEKLNNYLDQLSEFLKDLEALTQITEKINQDIEVSHSQMVSDLEKDKKGIALLVRISMTVLGMLKNSKRYPHYKEACGKYENEVLILREHYQDIIVSRRLNRDSDYLEDLNALGF